MLGVGIVKLVFFVMEANLLGMRSTEELINSNSIFLVTISLSKSYNIHIFIAAATQGARQKNLAFLAGHSTKASTVILCKFFLYMDIGHIYVF